MVVTYDITTHHFTYIKLDNMAFYFRIEEITWNVQQIKIKQQEKTASATTDTTVLTLELE